MVYKMIFSGLILMASFALAGPGRAQTISYGDAITVLAKDCGADIKKYCRGLNLGNNEIRNCGEQACASHQFGRGKLSASVT
ncbi:hypothetical protein [Mesorhizobium onobrychidis]|uniref:Uncharacterized protein n=1 Tax=Mesorhizobium onobrychidis TaxID=2775404 RepID=A0ABY5QTE6_9HYPH|nr:hypothetical protein [Mesorhizobium onobrychidis]UVC14446.1 hypothetical protein IHQ72_28005 [Mesorhizobium onobrychidis]